MTAELMEPNVALAHGLRVGDYRRYAGRGTGGLTDA